MMNRSVLEEEENIEPMPFDATRGKMTYRFDFEHEDNLCLWQAEMEKKGVLEVVQTYLLPQIDMDLAFDTMDTMARDIWEKTANPYWGIYLVNMLFVTLKDAHDWKVDGVLMEHEGSEDSMSFSIEIYRDPDTFEIEMDGK